MSAKSSRNRGRMPEKQLRHRSPDVHHSFPAIIWRHHIFQEWCSCSILRVLLLESLHKMYQLSLVTTVLCNNHRIPVAYNKKYKSFIYLEWLERQLCWPLPGSHTCLGRGSQLALSWSRLTLAVTNGTTLLCSTCLSPLIRLAQACYHSNGRGLQE